MITTPENHYREQCEKGTITDDPVQRMALVHLQRIFEELVKKQTKQSNFLSYFRKPVLVTGLYMWGGVGIGKTFLMDCFYEALPTQRKLRMHFHPFMRLVHAELTRYQGRKNPLDTIANEIAKKTDVLCFDEFFVSDITDAMLLAKLLKALFERGVCLVTTSNTPPDELYKNGLQRSQFLPAIALIKEHTDVIHLPTTIDYRLRHLKEAGVFYTPLDQTAQDNMERSFATLTAGKTITTDPVEINSRKIQIVKEAGDVIWFDFDTICSVPRSQADYLTIAEKYRTVFISNITPIPAGAKDLICLFINLIDVLYDARTRLVFSSSEPISQLYSRGYMIMEYARTHSRLLEMQSEDYFTHNENET